MEKTLHKHAASSIMVCSCLAWPALTLPNAKLVEKQSSTEGVKKKRGEKNKSSNEEGSLIQRADAAESMEVSCPCAPLVRVTSMTSTDKRCMTAITDQVTVLTLKETEPSLQRETRTFPNFGVFGFPKFWFS